MSDDANGGDTAPAVRSRALASAVAAGLGGPTLYLLATILERGGAEFPVELNLRALARAVGMDHSSFVMAARGLVDIGILRKAETLYIVDPTHRDPLDLRAETVRARRIAKVARPLKAPETKHPLRPPGGAPPPMTQTPAPPETTAPPYPAQLEALCAKADFFSHGTITPEQLRAAWDREPRKFRHAFAAAGDDDWLNAMRSAAEVEKIEEGSNRVVYMLSAIRGILERKEVGKGSIPSYEAAYLPAEIPPPVAPAPTPAPRCDEPLEPAEPISASAMRRARAIVGTLRNRADAPAPTAGRRRGPRPFVPLADLAREDPA